MFEVIGVFPIAALLAGLGARVVWRAREARAGTDALIGIYFICMGIGCIPALLPNDARIFGEAAGAGPMAVGHAMLSLGAGALYIFVWRCFGPGSGPRLWLAMLGCSTLGLLYVLQGVLEGFQAPGGWTVQLAALVRAGALVWALYESLRYWQLMNRRVRLGLADPLVANRFLLWCLWMGGMLTSVAIAITIRFIDPDFSTQAPLGLFVAVSSVMSTLAATAAASLWLAFFPPRAYVRWIKDRSTTQPA